MMGLVSLGTARWARDIKATVEYTKAGINFLGCDTGSTRSLGMGFGCQVEVCWNPKKKDEKHAGFDFYSALMPRLERETVEMVGLCLGDGAEGCNENVYTCQRE